VLASALMRGVGQGGSGLGNGVAQSVGELADTFKLARVDGHTAIVLPEVLQHHVHPHLAGYFAGGLSTHAVAYHEDSIPGIVTEIILVVLADRTYIPFPGHLHRQTHVFSIFCAKSAGRASTLLFWTWSS